MILMKKNSYINLLKRSVEGQECYKKRRITGEARKEGKIVKMIQKRECRKIRGKNWSKRSSFSEKLVYRIINLTTNINHLYPFF